MLRNRLRYYYESAGQIVTPAIIGITLTVLSAATVIVPATVQSSVVVPDVAINQTITATSLPLTVTANNTTITVSVPVNEIPLNVTLPSVNVIQRILPDSIAISIGINDIIGRSLTPLALPLYPAFPVSGMSQSVPSPVILSLQVLTPSISLGKVIDAPELSQAITILSPTIVVGSVAIQANVHNMVITIPTQSIVAGTVIIQPAVLPLNITVIDGNVTQGNTVTATEVIANIVIPSALINRTVNATSVNNAIVVPTPTIITPSFGVVVSAPLFNLSITVNAPNVIGNSAMTHYGELRYNEFTYYDLVEWNEKQWGEFYWNDGVTIGINYANRLYSVKPKQRLYSVKPKKRIYFA